MAIYGKRMMMTLVGGFSLLFVTFGTMSLGNATAVGEKLTAAAYCTRVDDKFMRTFTDMLETRGAQGYLAFLQHPGTYCYDVRIGETDGTPVNAVRATVVERMWDFQLPTGNRYTMWKVKDDYDHIAYTWTKREGRGA